MIDKLADALVGMVRVYFDHALTRKETDDKIDDLMHQAYKLVIEHEATKAATPDDVALDDTLAYTEAKLRQSKECGFKTITVLNTHIESLRKATLRQGVTLPRDKWDEMWQRAYDRSRFSSVFNDKPTFKKAIEDELVALGILDQHARGG